MRNIWVIAIREFKHYFISPIAYAVAFMIFLIIGIIFYANVLAATVQQFAPTIQVVFGPMVTIFLFTTPAITMRTLADEQKTGTLLPSGIGNWLSGNGLALSYSGYLSFWSRGFTRSF